MYPKIFSFILLLIVFQSLTSCTDDFESNGSTTFKEVIRVTAELTNTNSVEVSLLKNIALGAEISTAQLRDAVVELTSSEFPNNRMPLHFDSEMNLYLLDDMDYRLKEGSAYGIEIKVNPDTPEEKILKASTFLPKAVKAVGHELRDIQVETNPLGNKTYRMTFIIKLEEPESLPAYYQIVPYRGHTEYMLNNQGENVLVNLGLRYVLKVDEILESQNGVFTLAHKDGVYVDQSRIEDNTIKLIVETTNSLSKNEILKILEIDIFTLNEDLYKYNMALDAELGYSRPDYSNQSPRFSNIENGEGVFGGSSKVIYPIFLF